MRRRTSHDAPQTTAPAWHWGDDAACRDVPLAALDVFFPDSYTGMGAVQVREAKTWCRRCPVTVPCLEAALRRRDPHGVWGGLDPDERHELLAPERDVQAAAVPAA